MTYFPWRSDEKTATKRYTKDIRRSFPWGFKSRGCCSFKATEGEAVVDYRNPLATQKMQYYRLSRRVNNRTIFILALDVTFGEINETALIL